MAIAWRNASADEWVRKQFGKLVEFSDLHFEADLVIFIVVDEISWIFEERECYFYRFEDNFRDEVKHDDRRHIGAGGVFSIGNNWWARDYVGKGGA